MNEGAIREAARDGKADEDGGEWCEEEYLREESQHDKSIACARVPTMNDIAVLLHNVRSAHNVGSVFRTSDAVGVSRMILTGYTPVPVDRFGRIQRDIAKTALGAERDVPWESHGSPTKIIETLRERGWRIIGIEQDERSRDYRQFRCDGPTLFVFGNEVRGLSRELRNQCDSLLEIPMRGKKESLNVSVAAGIILFSVL